MSLIITKTGYNFQCILPPCIVFGNGVAAKAGEQAKGLGISKAFVVTDKILASTDGFKAVIETLKQAKVNSFIWSEIKGEPADTSIAETAAAYKREGCDGIIAFGGGSSIDTAKSAGVIALNGGKINDYGSLSPSPLPISKAPPLITIPTTAGTGSEITPFAVITDSSKQVKFFLANPILFAKVSLIDPTLYLSLPPYQTASTGMDAFTHAVEAYISTLENPISDAYALYAVELIAQNLRRAVYKGNDIEARTNMALASIMGGLSLVNGMVCAPHCVGEPIGARYHVAHGATCAFSLPAGLEYLRPARQEKMGKLAQAMGVNTEKMTEVEAARASVSEVAQLMRDIGIPTLAEATGMKEADIPVMAKLSFEHACNQFNPRPCTVEAYVEILKETLRR